MPVCIICNDSSKNTGRPKDAKPFGVVQQLFAVAIKADDGTENVILSGDTFDQTFLDGKINEPDPSKRYFPINDLENWDGAPRAETGFETFNSGNKSRLSDGVKSATALVPQTVSQYFGQLKKLGECNEIGLFMVDGCENFRGNGRVVGELKPIRVARNTWDLILAWAIDASNAQNTMIAFDFDKLEKDEDLAHIPKSSITADLTIAEGLRDVTFENAVLTASDDTLIVDLKSIYGNPFDEEGIKGIELADLTMTVAGGAAVILSVTEGTNGNYVIVLTTDVILSDTFTITGSKDGLEFTLFEGIAIA